MRLPISAFILLLALASGCFRSAGNPCPAPLTPDEQGRCARPSTTPPTTGDTSSTGSGTDWSLPPDDQLPGQRPESDPPPQGGATDAGGSTDPGDSSGDHCGSGGCPEPPPPCPGAEAGVRISELLPNPAGTDFGREFIELEGPPGTSLQDLQVVALNGRGGAPYGETVLLSGVIPASGYWVIGVDSPLPFLLQNGPDSVALLHCDGETVLDAVAYGVFGIDDIAQGEGRPAPVREGWSVARCPGAPDTNNNALDFALALPTPGGPNLGFEDPWRCTPCEGTEPGTVVINEFYPDPPGPDGNGEQEFIELWGPPGHDLEGLILIGIDGLTGNTILGPVHLKGTIPNGQRWVIGGSSVVEASMALPGLIQNGPDCIAIIDCAGTVIDALAYGDFGALEPPLGEGSPAPAPLGKALGRIEGMDTDDNAADFIRLPYPTPGAPNPF